MGFQTQSCLYRSPAQLQHERGRIRQGENPPSCTVVRHSYPQSILRQARIYLCRDFQVQQTPGRTGYALREVALCSEESL